MKKADLIIWMVDLSAGGWRRRLVTDLITLPDQDKLLVGNKIDLVSDDAGAVPEHSAEMTLLSCTTRKGLKELTTRLRERINARLPDLTSGVIVTSARHRQKLTLAARELNKARRLLGRDESPEITAFHLRAATGALDEITGKVYTEEILGRIISRFCVGK